MPFVFHSIFEKPDVAEYLQKRGLLAQYKKAKQQILTGDFGGNLLKFRQPIAEKVLYFRINKKYRALCQQRGELLFVFDIDDHQ